MPGRGWGQFSQASGAMHRWRSVPYPLKNTPFRAWAAQAFAWSSPGRYSCIKNHLLLIKIGTTQWMQGLKNTLLKKWALRK